MPPNAALWVKTLSAGAAMCIGGPALVWWVTPTEEELFKRYNPELQKRSLEGRETRQQEFDDFVGRMKEYAKSDKPIWVAAEEDERRKKSEGILRQRQEREEAFKQREAIKQLSVGGEANR